MMPRRFTPQTPIRFMYLAALTRASLVRDIVQIYNVGTGTWEPNGTPMPDAAGRYFAAAVYYPGDGRIYVFGGFDGVTFSEQTNAWGVRPGHEYLGYLSRVDSRGDWRRWIQHCRRFRLSAGPLERRLGSTHNYRYDILNKSWTTKAPVPVNIYRPDSAAIGTNTYLVGGGDPFISSRVKAKAGKMASAPVAYHFL